MKSALAAALLVLLALSGCSSAGAADSARMPGGSLTTEPLAPSETAAPATPAPEATSAAKTPAEEAGFENADDMFLRSLDGQVPDSLTDDQLKAAGAYTCDELRAGASKESVIAVVGDPEANTSVVIYAIRSYCPEFD
jgi:hypothetical protein